MFWTHTMELRDDMGHVESCFSLFGDSVSVGARLVHGLRQMYHRLRNRFGRIRCNSQVTRLKCKLVSIRLEIVLILMQDRCMVCVERTIGSEIIFDEPNGTPKIRDSCQILFRSVWRRCYCQCKMGARFAPNVP